MRSGPGVRPERPKAYVSAASRGLSFEIARQLARDGSQLALSSRHPEHLAAASAKITGELPGSEILTIPADLCRPDDQGRLLDALSARGFDPDVFVCSAGHPKDIGLSELSHDEWLRNMEMILGQAVFATKRFAPKMAERGYGRIILLSSIAAKTPDPQFFMSSLARSGLFSLSKMVSDEYGGRGVAAFVICLGYVDTPLLRNLALNRAPDGPDPTENEPLAWAEKYEEWSEHKMPSRRIATTAELASLVSFLTLPQAEYLTGTVFSFSGGMDKGLV